MSFTGSVVGGRAVEEAAVGAKGIKGVALEVCLSVRYFRVMTDLSLALAWGERPSIHTFGR